MIIIVAILYLLYSYTILTSPVSVTDGGTGVTSLTAYALLTTGTTTIAPVQQVSGTGSATQVLTSNGTGALPTWQADGNTGTTNGCVFIKTVTASNSAYLEFTSTDLSPTYKVFMIVFNNLLPAATGYLQAYWSTNNGSSLLTSGYTSGINYLSTYTSTSFTNLQDTVSLRLSKSTTTYVSGILYLYGANGALTSGPALTGIIAAGFTTPAYTNVQISISGNPNINYMQFFFSSGNITSGHISLYGLT